MTVARLAAAETAALLPFAPLVSAIRRAAVEKDDGAIDCPARQVVALADGATMLSMPAVAADIAIHKLITIAPGNAALGLPALLGALTVIDPASGRPLLVLDGPTVTARRTAAVSLCAIDALVPAATRFTIVGTGAQARHHADALIATRPGCRIRVRGTTFDRARAFCESFASTAFDLAATTGDGEPDVVITCTSSKTPVYSRPAGTTPLVVAIGVFDPERAEVDAQTVRDSTIYVDDPDGARHEAGDLLLAGVDWTTVTSLADLVRVGPMQGQRPPLFKSVGCAAWDLAAARVALAAW